MLTQSTDKSIVGDAARFPTAAIQVDRAIFNLSSFTSGGHVPTLIAPEAQFGEAEVDIAIACVDSVWEQFRIHKAKQAINLDVWSEPPWSQISQCVAFGYFDEHKAVSAGIVQTPMGEIAADLASSLEAERSSFVLSSQLANPPGYYFSGVSGGPVFALWGENEEAAEFAPVGIVFEGSPGSSRAAPGDGSYLSQNDIFIRALTLTPARFCGWLERLREVGK